jgi:uncharacterized protein (DUF1499 family)
MKKYFSLSYKWSIIVMSITLFSCAGQKPEDVGVFDNKFSPCPGSPNCVSSDANDKSHFVNVFKLNRDLENNWQAVHDTVSSLMRTKVITFDEQYIHAECSSAVFGFVDDLQLHLRNEGETVAIKSEARLGYSDLGVNKSRVRNLRELLLKNNIIVK